MHPTTNTLSSLAIFSLIAGSANAGTLVLNPFADGADSSSGISATITYTHKIDVNKDADTAVINTVSFDNTGAYTLTGPGNNFPNYNSPADNGSGLDVLMNNFKYGGQPATLTLTGLAAGETYKLRLYVGGFGGNLQDFSFDDTVTPTTYDDVPRNAGTDAVPGSIDYTYTLGAGDTDLEMVVGPQVTTDSFHFYGFSNEVVPVPEPSSTALLGLGGLALILRRRK
jgi:hypothetical protein